MSTLPANLPDERTAQRLLEVLSKLEAAFPALALSSKSGNGREQELEQQVYALRRKQHEARTRLQTLAEKLESLPQDAQMSDLSIGDVAA